MHVYFSGIGGAGIGPLALIAHRAGFDVSGSDLKQSDYIDYLKKQGVRGIHIGQDKKQISQIHKSKPIDWLVYSSAVVKENPDHPELVFAKENAIKATRRDKFINKILEDNNQKMIAIAGTHGKTTTTAMVIWLFKKLDIPLSYSLGAKLSFGEMGEFDPSAEYFVYEADEYDKNFLSFTPELSIISGIGYDHPDIYPKQVDYNKAFLQFINQSKNVRIWAKDFQALRASMADIKNVTSEPELTSTDLFKLTGEVNRRNAQLVAKAISSTGICRFREAVRILNTFPGISRRFEKVATNVYSDYAHTPKKIQGALQMAKEMTDGKASKVVVVYEGLHNTRQHFIKKELATLFKGIKKLYVVPSYLAREDKKLELLTPEKLCEIIKKPKNCEPVQLDEELENIISKHVNKGDLVLCLSAGGGGSLDEWLRKQDFRS